MITYYIDNVDFNVGDKLVNTEKGNLIIYCVFIPAGEKHDIRMNEFINPLASPGAGAPALKYGDVNTVTPPLARSKG